MNPAKILGFDQPVSEIQSSKPVGGSEHLFRHSAVPFRNRLIDIFEGFLSTGTFKKTTPILSWRFFSQKQEEVKKQKAEWQERLDVAQKRQKEPWCRMRLEQCHLPGLLYSTIFHMTNNLDDSNGFHLKKPHHF